MLAIAQISFISTGAAFAVVLNELKKGVHDGIIAWLIASVGICIASLASAIVVYGRRQNLPLKLQRRSLEAAERESAGLHSTSSSGLGRPRGHTSHVWVSQTTANDATWRELSSDPDKLRTYVERMEQRLRRMSSAEPQGMELLELRTLYEEDIGDHPLTVTEPEPEGGPSLASTNNELEQAFRNSSDEEEHVTTISPESSSSRDSALDPRTQPVRPFSPLANEMSPSQLREVSSEERHAYIERRRLRQEEKDEKIRKAFNSREVVVIPVERRPLWSTEEQAMEMVDMGQPRNRTEPPAPTPNRPGESSLRRMIRLVDDHFTEHHGQSLRTAIKAKRNKAKEKQKKHQG